MRKIKLTQINNNIDQNRKKIAKSMNEKRQRNPKINSRKYRSENKQKLLLEVTKATIKNAREQGKFRTTGERKLYYDPT